MNVKCGKKRKKMNESNVSLLMINGNFEANYE